MRYEKVHVVTSIAIFHETVGHTLGIILIIAVEPFLCCLSSTTRRTTFVLQTNAIVSCK